MTTKDEIKNRISMTLRSPVLQQGFEIICRENVELEKENAGLKARLNDINLLTPELEKQSKVKKQQLTKAKEIIKNLLDVAKFYNKHRDKGAIMDITPIYDAEQFLKEADK